MSKQPDTKSSREPEWSWIDDDQRRASDAARLLREVYPGVFNDTERTA